VRSKAELEAQINENRVQAEKYAIDLRVCGEDLKSKIQEIQTI
jgi:hypothetical protein